jgi:hypothetical protein
MQKIMKNIIHIACNTNFLTISPDSDIVISGNLNEKIILSAVRDNVNPANRRGSIQALQIALAKLFPLDIMQSLKDLLHEISDTRLSFVAILKHSDLHAPSSSFVDEEHARMNSTGFRSSSGSQTNPLATFKSCSIFGGSSTQILMLIPKIMNRVIPIKSAKDKMISIYSCFYIATKQVGVSRQQSPSLKVRLINRINLLNQYVLDLNIIGVFYEPCLYRRKSKFGQSDHCKRSILNRELLPGLDFVKPKGKILPRKSFIQQYVSFYRILLGAEIGKQKFLFCLKAFSQNSRWTFATNPIPIISNKKDENRGISGLGFAPADKVGFAGLDQLKEPLQIAISESGNQKLKSGLRLRSNISHIRSLSLPVKFASSDSIVIKGYGICFPLECSRMVARSPKGGARLSPDDLFSSKLQLSACFFDALCTKFNPDIPQMSEAILRNAA